MGLTILGISVSSEMCIVHSLFVGRNSTRLGAKPNDTRMLERTQHFILILNQISQVKSSPNDRLVSWHYLICPNAMHNSPRNSVAGRNFKTRLLLLLWLTQTTLQAISVNSAVPLLLSHTSLCNKYFRSYVTSFPHVLVAAIRRSPTASPTTTISIPVPSFWVTGFESWTAIPTEPQTQENYNIAQHLTFHFQATGTYGLYTDSDVFCSGSLPAAITVQTGRT
jgi:hypothetical protein